MSLHRSIAYFIQVSCSFVTCGIQLNKPGSTPSSILPRASPAKLHRRALRNAFGPGLAWVCGRGERNQTPQPPAGDSAKTTFQGSLTAGLKKVMSLRRLARVFSFFFVSLCLSLTQARSEGENPGFARPQGSYVASKLCVLSRYLRGKVVDEIAN